MDNFLNLRFPRKDSVILALILSLIFLGSSLPYTLNQSHARSVPSFVAGQRDSQEFSTPVLNEQGFGRIDNDRISKLIIPFIENDGQVDERVGYYASTFAGTVFVAEDSITYTLMNGGSTHKGVQADYATVVKESLIFTAQPLLHPIGTDKGDAVVNYFVGSREDWHSNIPVYNSIYFESVWPFIDLHLYAHDRNVEKVFDLEPGSNVDDIQISFSGIRNIQVNSEGELVLDANGTMLTMTAPIAYQDIDGRRNYVDVSYVVHEQTYGFELGSSYDSDYPLIIDPLLASTYAGGQYIDEGSALAVDDSGNVYVAGRAETGYPTTNGAFDEINDSLRIDVHCHFDAFVSKFNGDLTKLISSTFIGGPCDDDAGAIAVDDDGNVYVAGSAEFGYPTTPGAYQETRVGCQSLFGCSANGMISKLDGDLTTLLASTYIGGTTISVTRVNSISLHDGNVFIAVETRDPAFPTTTGSFDETFNGGYDIAVSKLNSDLTTLLASTFVGGAGNEIPKGITLDNSGNVYVAGSADLGYPTTSGAYDETFNGSGDVAISKLSNDLATLLGSTFIGGTGFDGMFTPMITTDASSNVYVAVVTDGVGYPTTPGSFDETRNGDNDVAISKLSPDLSALEASTFLGGTGRERVTAIALDSLGYVYVAGDADAGFPATPGAFDETHNGAADGFISKLDNNLSSLVASTYIGGINNDGILAMAVDSGGSVYVAGRAESGYPTTPGAFDETFSSGLDVIVSKLDGHLSAGQLVRIDIKPGDPNNNVNLNARSLRVGLISTGSLDARTVVIDTVTFGPSNAKVIGSAIRDLDSDGDLDMILKFRVTETGIECGQTNATLTGETSSGLLIFGTDDLKTKC